MKNGTQKILHEALKLINSTGHDHLKAKEELGHFFPDVKTEDLDNLYLKACRLAEMSYEIADMVRDKKLTESQALKELEERCPGFSQKAYEEAFSMGWSESMW